MQKPVKKISRFQFITPPDIEKKEMVLLFKKVCDGGIDWIQLRVKNKNTNEWINLAHAAADICSEYNATLIINDSPVIAKQVNAAGTHLGKNDISVEQAKKHLDDSFIIGGTANTLEDVHELINQQVDYIGLGPYKFTKTKSVLRPILGPIGSEKIIQKATHYNIPIILIGGIKISDVQNILKAGAHGIAVTTSVSLSSDISQTVIKFRKEIHKFVKTEINV